ncbi:MAG: UTP--glucose-1-phosphate uridylyltransferase [Gaiellales bacterium]
MGDDAFGQLRAALAEHGQEQLLRFWDDLDGDGRARLERDLRALDLDLLDELVVTLVQDAQPPIDVEGLEPALPAPPPSPQDIAEGEAALRRGKVAVVIVAGGQGTRLGFDGPKGSYPIGPVTDRSLFQIHCEKIAALGVRHGRTPPLYVMTSDENHEATDRFLAEHRRFGLPHLKLFRQGTMPAVAASTGAVLLAERDRVALSPDGHGGTLRALERGGCLDDMGDHGVDTVFYLQVDNPMVAIADPGFVGAHRRAGADVSSKVVRKRDPAEKVGVVAERRGRQLVIEYSDLPASLADMRRADGSLAYSAGSIALHVFRLGFVANLARSAELPFHRARKQVPYVDEHGNRVEPVLANAIKFEQFIFDTLPLARRSLIIETSRTAEFEPLKNATGSSSPESVRRRLSDAAADLLEAVGAVVARRTDGSAAVPIELSPLIAADPADLRARVPPGTVIDRPVTIS